MRVALIIVALICFQISKSFAQDFDHLLGLPADSTIINMNFMVQTPVADIRTDLISAENQVGGGFNLTYRTIIPSNNQNNYTFRSFFFDEKNKLFSAAILFSAQEQLKEVTLMLREGYYKINEHVLNHKTQNLKVTIYNSSKNGKDQVIFLYSRKDYKTPDY